MHKNIGSQGFQDNTQPIQRFSGQDAARPIRFLSGLGKFLALAFGILLISQSAWATPQYLLILPGDTYSSGTAPDRSATLTQVAGEPFTATAQVYCYDPANSNLVATSSNWTTQITSSVDPLTVNPSGVFSLPTAVGAVPNAVRTGITMTLTPASTKFCTLNVSASLVGGGIAGDTLPVFVQCISQFGISVPGSYTAGNTYSVTVQALDAGSVLCNAFTKTAGAELWCLDGGVNGADVDLGPLNFVAGQATFNAQMFHATHYARFQVRKTNTPMVSSSSAVFTITPAAFSQLLTIGPGQSIESGRQSGGNGRVGGSTTTSAVTAGASFSVMVYAVDAFWNTATATSTNVALTCPSDAGFNPGPSSGNWTTNWTQFTGVQMHTVAGGNKSLIATDNSGSPLSTSDMVPVNPAALYNFGLMNFNTTDKAVGAGFSLDIKAFDQFGNTVTSVPGLTDLKVVESLSGNPLNWSYRSVTITPAFNSGKFTNGDWTGTLNVRKASNGYYIRVLNPNLVGGKNDFSTQTFNVNVGSVCSTNIVVLPGQTYTPGEYHTGIGWGRNGGASAEIAGTAFVAAVYATDTYGNMVNSDQDLNWFGSTQLTNPADSAATVEAGTGHPGVIQIRGGVATPSFILTLASGSQVLGLPNTGFGILDSGAFVVQSAALNKFSVTYGASQTAGAPFIAQITAQDQYSNTITNYNGTVYITSPNFDYNTPTESVLSVTNGFAGYTGVSATAWWRASGPWVNGIFNCPTTIYRSVNGSLQPYLFVSTVADDKPISHTGSYGTGANFTVANAPGLETWFMLAPGLQYRPGGIGNGAVPFAGDGFEGTCLSQQTNVPFAVTVYVTDQYFNIDTGSSANFNLITNPTDATFNNASQPYSDNVNGGQKSLAVKLPTPNVPYTFNISSPGSGSGINPYGGTPGIYAFTIGNFTFQHNGMSAPSIPHTWTAGHPVWVTITAWVSFGVQANTFAGDATLSCTSDPAWFGSYKSIRPDKSIHFVGGYWWGNITLFKSDQGMNKNIMLNFGSTQYPSDTVNVNHDDAVVNPYQMQIIVPGMQPYPGMNPDSNADIFQNCGMTGNPGIQTAGTAFSGVTFQICDHWWNPLYDWNGGATIQCSDPHPATLNGVNFSGGTIPITLTNGMYSADSVHPFILYTVNGKTGWDLGLTGAGTAFSLASHFQPVKVKHAAYGRSFQFIMPYTPKTAGVPFPVTVAVIDAYGNTLDSLNALPSYAFPSTNAVDLSVGTDGSGNKTIWPTKLGNLQTTRWIEGVSYPDVYCYCQSVGTPLTAGFDFGESGQSPTYKNGSSKNFAINPNAYSRVVAVIQEAGLGMKTPDAGGAGGSYYYTNAYSAEPPAADATIFNNFGIPVTSTAGTSPTILRGYTCDIYGNIVKNPTDMIHFATSDRFAPLPADRAAVASNGFAEFGNAGAGFAFRSQGLSSVTITDATVATMTAGSIPFIPVKHNNYFGMQVLINGLVAIQGSGDDNVNGTTHVPVPNGGWYSGVTQVTIANDPGFSNNSYYGRGVAVGAPFNVTVQAVDKYGNFVSDAPTHNIQLGSNDYDARAVPYTGATIQTALANGVAFFTGCKLYSNPGVISLIPKDLDDPNAGTASAIKNGVSGDTIGLTRVSGASDLHYVAIVTDSQGRQVKLSDTTLQPVVLEAYPNTFTVTIEVQSGTFDVVSLDSSFVMSAVLDQGLNPQLAPGTLAVVSRTTNYGTLVIPNESFSGAVNSMYILVSDAAGVLGRGFSPELQFKASAPKTITMTSDAKSINNGTAFQTVANQTAKIFATALDANGNPIVGLPMAFQITNTNASTLVEGSNTTDAHGTAWVYFKAGAQNLEHIVQATTGPATGTLSMFVSVTENGGVYPNPFNPLQRKTSIDYRLDQNAKVKINIYTLFGDLVFSKDFASGSPQGTTGVCTIQWDGKNNVGTTVANGGYIAVILVNDREKYRFKIGVFKEK